jgi:hypothetical protein
MHHFLVHNAAGQDGNNPSLFTRNTHCFCIQQTQFILTHDAAHLEIFCGHAGAVICTQRADNEQCASALCQLAKGRRICIPIF